jgi:hypothetical protein
MKKLITQKEIKEYNKQADKTQENFNKTPFTSNLKLIKKEGKK